MTRIGYC